MKTKLLLAIMLLVALIPAKAQVGGSPSGFTSLNFGSGYPIGDFASTDPSDANAGFAQVGYNFSLSAGIPIKHSNFGISALVGFGANSFDINSFLSAVETQTGGQFNYAVASQGSYSYFDILVGPYATIPVRRFSFDFRIMGGAMGASIPGIGVAISDNSGDEAGVGTASANSAGFAIDGGVGVRFSVTKHFGIMLNYDILYSAQSFNTTVQQLLPDGTGGYQQTSGGTTVNQTFLLFTSTLGIGYQF